ncbi:unnamed protein product, partial [Urochloa humidicola]
PIQSSIVGRRLRRAQRRARRREHSNGGGSRACATPSPSPREILLGFGFSGPAAMATEQAVEDLVALNPCNPDILNDLEKFVNEQVNSGHQYALASVCSSREV